MIALEMSSSSQYITVAPTINSWQTANKLK